MGMSHYGIMGLAALSYFSRRNYCDFDVAEEREAWASLPLQRGAADVGGVAFAAGLGVGAV